MQKTTRGQRQVKSPPKPGSQNPAQQQHNPIAAGLQHQPQLQPPADLQYPPTPQPPDDGQSYMKGNNGSFPGYDLEFGPPCKHGVSFCYDCEPGDEKPRQPHDVSMT